MSQIVRSRVEIDKVLNWASGSENSGETHFPGMSYESGLLSMYEWLVGDIDDNPME